MTCVYDLDSACSLRQVAPCTIDFLCGVEHNGTEGKSLRGLRKKTEEGKRKGSLKEENREIEGEIKRDFGEMREGIE